MSAVAGLDQPSSTSLTLVDRGGEMDVKTAS